MHAGYFEKGVVLGNRCDSSSIMHLEMCFKAYVIMIFLRVVCAKKKGEKNFWLVYMVGYFSFGVLM